MCVKILNSAGIILTVIGTIWSIWSVLRMSEKDIEQTLTAGYQDNQNNIRTNGLRTQKKQTIKGLFLISIGSLLQLLAIWL